MYDDILIPFDGSDEARKGAVHGIELAASVGATVTALYIINLPGVPRSLSIRDDEEQMREEYREYAEEVLDEICGVANDHGVDCEQAIRSGRPSEEIIEYAEENGMDAIVMGSAYRGKLGSLIGGTTDKVVRSATVPVITHRMHADEL